MSHANRTSTTLMSASYQVVLGRRSSAKVISSRRQAKRKRSPDKGGVRRNKTVRRTIASFRINLRRIACEKDSVCWPPQQLVTSSTQAVFFDRAVAKGGSRAQQRGFRDISKLLLTSWPEPPKTQVPGNAVRITKWSVLEMHLGEEIFSPTPHTVNNVAHD